MSTLLESLFDPTSLLRLSAPQFGSVEAGKYSVRRFVERVVSEAEANQLEDEDREGRADGLAIIELPLVDSPRWTTAKEVDLSKFVLHGNVLSYHSRVVNLPTVSADYVVWFVSDEAIRECRAVLRNPALLPAQGASWREWSEFSPHAEADENSLWDVLNSQLPDANDELEYRAMDWVIHRLSVEPGVCGEVTGNEISLGVTLDIVPVDVAYLNDILWGARRVVNAVVAVGPPKKTVA